MLLLAVIHTFSHPHILSSTHSSFPSSRRRSDPPTYTLKPPPRPPRPPPASGPLAAVPLCSKFEEEDTPLQAAVYHPPRGEDTTTSPQTLPERLAHRHRLIYVRPSSQASLDLAHRHRLLGEAKFQLSKFEEANALLLAVEQRAPPNLFAPSLYLRLGTTFLVMGAWDKATDFFLKSVREQGAFAEAWVGLAFAAYRMEDVDRAYEALQEGISGGIWKY